MTTKTQKKMCWNCEGNVDIDNEVCPYCGVHVENIPITGSIKEKSSFIIPKAPYPSKVESLPSDTTQENEEVAKSEEENAPPELLHHSLLSLLSLLTGSVLVVFSLLLFFFSNSEGEFTLSWNGHYWYFYTLAAIPLLYYAGRSLSDLVD